MWTNTGSKRESVLQSMRQMSNLTGRRESKTLKITWAYGGSIRRVVRTRIECNHTSGTELNRRSVY